MKDHKDQAINVKILKNCLEEVGVSFPKKCIGCFTCSPTCTRRVDLERKYASSSKLM